MNIYGYTFEVECPNSPGEFVEYTLLIKSEKMIMAESIIEVCTIEKPMFHEQIADLIKDYLPGVQTLSAEHCGVDILTER